MRHDDTIMTAVALARKDSPDARAAALRQLIDLSLQERAPASPAATRAAFGVLVRLIREAPLPLVNALIDKAARGGGGALHLRLFRHQISHHYDRLLQLARLGEGDWWRFAHRAPPHLRAQLVERRDLPASVRDFLTMRLSGAERLFGGNGTAAVVGPAGTPPPPVPELDVAAATPALDSGRSQVRELIDRIAAFRARDRAAADATPTVERAPVPPTETRWTWRCDEQGMFVPSPDAPAALPGHWLTEFDTPEAPLQLVRAFERRAPFRDSIVAIEIDTLGGRWRLAGLPQFDRRSGRFTGYWGSAIAIDRAPPADSRAEGLFGTGASSEALSTMAHEVRTPLNAIIGFAQLIESEILGEAGDAYKAKAGTILKHAERLLSAFDDLSDAARIDQGRYRTSSEPFDCADRARAVIAPYAALAAGRGAQLVPFVAANMPAVEADSSVFDRMLSRLLTAAVGAARDGEAIFIVVQPATDERVRVAVSRPRATLGLDGDALLDPSAIANSDGVDSAALGIGFGLKLVQSLAGTIGASFDIGAHAFELMLPVRQASREIAAS